MTCKDIIIAKLKELGADGLCCEDCGCGIDDLFPCGEDCLDCVPAKRRLDLYDKQTDIYNPLNEQIKVRGNL